MDEETDVGNGKEISLLPSPWQPVRIKVEDKRKCEDWGEGEGGTERSRKCNSSNSCLVRVCSTFLCQELVCMQFVTEC